ncbi:endoglucanase D precursor [Ruminiclostridium hungatei]|uniref:Endoglucanase n=1 Tax=Ruminiclostridium hungatei TaxID=48256 RepID=A0A1V4SFC8_RUMHU|nr:glycoside hydrolase family 9 protein [Ruminiclostridium hungatei]OPX42589.1 endoglucanase D precursor [Ruminiclostridium hungatei]
MTASCTSKNQSDNTPASTSVSANTVVASATGQQPEAGIISQDIHINQIGYKIDDKKIAVIKGVYKSFEVFDAETGKAVLVKETGGKVSDESSGDTVCYADFSELKASGSYFISVEGLGKSYDFKIGESTLFSKVNDALVKALYYQRCGIVLDSKYAGEYIHGSCHTGKAILYGNEEVQLDVGGGWHDAGDYGRYVVPAAVTAADLMLAYEFYPQSFTSPLNIPESSNNIPDILDEAKYGLEWLLKMQDEKSGGVYHKVTSRNFPDIAVMPDIDVDDLFIMPVSTTATADFAAVTAMASRIFKDFDPDFSKKCLAAAVKAWNWLEANKSFIAFKNPQDVSSGEYGDSSGDDERAWAAAELLRATGIKKYNEYFKANYQTGGFGLGWQNVSGFAAIAYLFADTETADSGKADEIRKAWLEKADMFVSTAQKNGYLLAMHKMEYNWGSNMNVANHAMHMLIADKLSNSEKYTESAADCAHYLLGRNTLNQSYITGYGSQKVMQPHHRPSAGDSVKDPVPGLLVGGPDSALEDDSARASLSGKAPAQCYIDDITSFSTNEVATYWNSAAIFVFSYMGSN